jgi:hypothetical protein
MSKDILSLDDILEEIRVAEKYLQKSLHSPTQSSLSIKSSDVKLNEVSSTSGSKQSFVQEELKPFHEGEQSPAVVAKNRYAGLTARNELISKLLAEHERKLK